MDLESRIARLCAFTESDLPVVTLTLDVSGSGILSKQAAVFLQDRVYRLLERDRNGGPRAARLRTAATRIRDYIASSLRPETEGLYLAVGSSVLEATELRVPLRTSVQLGSAPGVAPLVEAGQKWPKALYVRYDDRAVEIREFDLGVMTRVESKTVDALESDVEHSGVGARAIRHGLRAGGSGVGGDRRDRYQQRGDDSVEIMFREAARIINARVRTDGELILLEGNRRRMNMLVRHLNPGARSSILDAHGQSRRNDLGPSRVKTALEKAYRDEVESRVLEFHSRRAEGRDVILGPEGVIQAMTTGGIARLFVSADDPVPAVKCSNCGSLFAGFQEKCSHCGGDSRPVSLTEEALRQSIRHRSFGVTFIPASGRWLADLGGMAALLRR